MWLSIVLVWFIVLGLVIWTVTGQSSPLPQVLSQRTGACFPVDFEWAVATAAYQVEGAVTADGRGRSIWDVVCDKKNPWYGKLSPGVPTAPGQPKLQAECGEVAINMRYTFDDDFGIMRSLGAQAYRLSLSWNRMMTWDASAKKMVANPKGIAYYHELFRSLSRHAIKPFVTLYHWDLPYEIYLNTLRDYRGNVSGGWTNPDIVDHFLDFSTLAFQEFGPYVSKWFTFNEARTFVFLGYEIGAHPPFEKGLGYVANKIVLLAHAKAVHAFRKLRDAAGWTSIITLVVCSGAAMPKHPDSVEDRVAADRQNEFEVGIYLSPIYYGNYPAVVLSAPGFKGFGFDAAFTQEEQDLLIGTHDGFIGLNYYGSMYVQAGNRPPTQFPWESDEISGFQPAGLPEDVQLSGVNAHHQRLCPWFTGSPKGYRAMINWVHRASPQNTSILLTENGYCGSVDYSRADGYRYYRKHLRAVWESITEDQIPVIGYTAWSYADNYEWGSYEPRFGLMYVDRDNSQLPRISKPEAYFFRRVAKSGCLPQRY